MLYKQNLHTHTTYCDGKNTPEEIIVKSIEDGFDCIGFSGHTPMFGLNSKWAMSNNALQSYQKEISFLREKYKDKINVLCGIEMELNLPIKSDDFDYVIGSIHFLLVNGELVEFDNSAEKVKWIIENYYNGNGLKYVEAYYNRLVEVFQNNKVDIVGHFDIIAKHSEKYNFFDTKSFQYRSLAIEALREVSKRCDVFEMNTGAIARGYRTSPYPSPFLLQELKRLGSKIIISSDCHDKNQLYCCFDDCIEILKANKIEEVFVLKNGSFHGQKI